MRREQAALVRLVLIAAAWAIGQVLTYGLANDAVGLVVPAALAIGAYVLTEDLGRARFGGGPPKYWRGRRIDDDERRDRWN